MKIYLRILQYAPGAGSQFFKFLIYSILASVFSAVYLGLLGPMLDILFLQKIEKVVAVAPEFSFTAGYFKTWFQYHFANTVQTQGPVNTLLYVCLSIVGFVFLSNVFRYMERMVASRLKVDVVKNIRVDIFRNVSQLHIGFFNDQRKGDLISRFTNDVGEVENTVVNGFKAIKEPITLIIYITMLFLISVQLTLFTLIVLPVTGGVISIILNN